MSRPSTSPPTTSISPSTRALARRMTSELIAMTRPGTWPARVNGPRRTATSPGTSRPASISSGPLTRNPVLVLNSIAASRATSSGSPRLRNAVSGAVCSCADAIIAHAGSIAIAIARDLRIATPENEGSLARLALHVPDRCTEYNALLRKELTTRDRRIWSRDFLPEQHTHRVGPTSLFSADRDPEPPHAPIEIGPVRLQSSSCLGHVPSRHGEVTCDQHLL